MRERNLIIDYEVSLGRWRDRNDGICGKTNLTLKNNFTSLLNSKHMYVKHLFYILVIVSACNIAGYSQNDSNDGQKERANLIKSLTKIADPLLTALSQNQLKLKMPVEKVDGMHKTSPSTYLEGFARLLAGMAPWLELGPDATEEGKLRKKYIDLAILCLHNGTDTASPDYLDFNIQGQSLVDAAFLTHALLRAPTQLWARLDEQTKQNLVTALKRR